MGSPTHGESQDRQNVGTAENTVPVREPGLPDEPGRGDRSDRSSDGDVEVVGYGVEDFEDGDSDPV